MKSKINYNLLFDSMNTALYIILNSKIIDCNCLAALQSGWDKVDLIGKQFLEVFPIKEIEIRDSIAQKIAAAQSGIGKNFEAVQLRADGQIFDVEINLTYTKPFLIASVQDISERKKRETLLEESEKLYKKIVEESLSNVYVIQDGKVVYTNEKRHLELNKKYGAWNGSVIGREAISLVHPDDREMIREQISDIFKGRRTAPYQHRLAMNEDRKSVV
jgi:PAS domain S-box-containing protein